MNVYELPSWLVHDHKNKILFLIRLIGVLGDRAFKSSFFCNYLLKFGLF